jgi:hypothetical protein
MIAPSRCLRRALLGQRGLSQNSNAAELLVINEFKSVCYVCLGSRVIKRAVTAEYPVFDLVRNGS